MECFFFAFKPLTLVALFLILLSAPPSMADDDNNNVKGGGVFVRDITTNSSSNSPPPMSSENQARSIPFRPSMVVIIVALGGIFSVVFLILLYAKHCSGEGVVVVTATPATARKNSGIDRGVVESLPAFRFGSLRGQKEGLDCAVCLNRFDSNEVLRLLPKCKHAFHVECVDTWLDAHSTCPLCRYRVDPEDILLVDRNPPPESRQNSTHEVVLDVNVNPIGNKQFSGRHSSGGEKGILRSKSHDPSLRRSLDSAGVRRKSQSLRAIGSYDYPRKDGLLSTSLDRGNSRVEHRIIVSSNSSRAHERWSDAQPSDLLYLGSEMIMSDSRRFLSTSRSRQQQHSNGIDGSNGNGLRRWGGASSGGRNNTNTNTVINNNNNTVMNGRSVSEITGFSRFPIKADRANSTH
nr:RING-H2 finger protein ATL43-like [Quercus suber]POE69492.1 ring-h2 finger protein atl43 [Quercus suber]